MLESWMAEVGGQVAATGHGSRVVGGERSAGGCSAARRTEAGRANAAAPCEPLSNFAMDKFEIKHLLSCNAGEVTVNGNRQ